MENREQQNLRILLQAHRRRLHRLEQQAAVLGNHAPPQILTEIEDIQNAIVRIEAKLVVGSIPIDHVAIQHLRQQAMRAYFAKNWTQAVDLLAQVVVADQGDTDALEKLTRARQQMNLQEDYQAIHALRDGGRWQEVLDALDALELRYPGYPDYEGLRRWAEGRQRFDPILSNLRSGVFSTAIHQLDAILKQHPTDHIATKLVAGLIRLPQVPLQLRLRAAEIAGRVGDPRIPVTIEEWQQNLSRCNSRFGSVEGYWCYVGAGTYRIGGWKSDQRDADIVLPHFWIARYPITMAQFALFVEANQSEDAVRWWTLNGQYQKQYLRTPNRLYFEELPFDRTTYSGANKPVIIASWYAAAAFTIWLTEQLAHLLPEGYIVRLPTDAEWEAAAAYDGAQKRHIYPWGEDEPTTERAIFEDCGLRQPTPVGVCPMGASFCGALDMVGNLWEWTMTPASHSDDEEEYYPERSGEPVSDFRRSQHVSLRGGSYQTAKKSPRCSLRKYAHPERDYFFGGGLRLVIARCYI